MLELEQVQRVDRVALIDVRREVADVDTIRLVDVGAEIAQVLDGQSHEILLDDAQADYLLFGFSGDMIVLGRREYQSRACQDPGAVDDVPTTFLGYDLVTGELVSFDSAPESP